MPVYLICTSKMGTNLFWVTFYLDINSNLKNRCQYGMRKFCMYLVNFTIVYIFSYLPYYLSPCLYIWMLLFEPIESELETHP